MWGRGISRDGDAAAAARRRLAAIAAEFDRGPVLHSGSPPVSPDPLRTPLDPSAAGSEGGRHRRVDQASDGGHRGLTPHHLALAALVAATVLTLAAWWALRADPQAEPLPVVSDSPPPAASTPSPGASPAPTPIGDAPMSASPDASLVVDVAGRVRRPGIVELPSGARVVDALSAAGGARPGVDTAGLNLARPLVDGEQIVVGLDVPPGPVAGLASPYVPSTTSSAAPASIDINTADQTALETLPGIGPVTAQSILDWRAEHGWFASVDQLLDVSGIGDATLADIEPYVHV